MLGRRAATWTAPLLLALMIVAFLVSVQGDRPADALTPRAPAAPDYQGAVAATSDWGQYQHDAARSGYNPSPTPYRRYDEAWSHDFRSEGVSAAAQPIIVGQRVYLGTQRGFVHALALASGAEAWRVSVTGGIVHTLAATSSSVFAATLAGRVYALDPANGAVQWQFQADDTFATAALLVETRNALYVVGESGVVYALNVQTGAELWRQDIGFPVRASPTFGDNRVYVGADDMRVRALDAASGQVVWVSSQLYGQGFQPYAPVFAAGKLIVTVGPESYTFTDNDTDLLKRASMDVSGTSLADAQAATVQWLQQNPRSQTFYALDAATGQMPYVPGVLYVVANNGPQPPPIYNNLDVIAVFSVAGPRWVAHQWGVDSVGALGVLDLATGRITQRLAGAPSELTADETNNTSGAGDQIFGARCQTVPGCVSISGQACDISQVTRYTLTNDLCLPGSAPVYASNFIVYQAFNTLIAYWGHS